MDHRVQAAETGPRAWRLPGSQSFESAELERLFRRYSCYLYRVPVGCTLVLLALLSGVQAALSAGYACRATLQNVAGAMHSLVFAVMLVLLQTKVAQRWQLLRVCYTILFFCTSLTVTTLAADLMQFTLPAETHGVSAEGVWLVSFISFLAYTMMPIYAWHAVMYGIGMAMIQIGVSFVTTKHYLDIYWYQFGANLLIMLSVNGCGLVLHRLTERIHRKAFLDTRKLVSARLDSDDENERLDRILLSLLPHHVASEMKFDLTNTFRESPLQKAYIQHHENLSFLFADIVGFTQLTAQCGPLELVRLMNELFGRFDHLANDNHCLRIRLLGDCYFCIAGVPEPRNDHARCCVEMGLDLIDSISSMVGHTNAQLSIRIGIHSGSASCYLSGIKRRQFEAWSRNVSMARRLQMSGDAGRVHVSRATIDSLTGEYDVDDAPGGTYYIVPPPRRRKALAMSTLEASLSMGTIQRHEIAIRNTANMAQLLHNIKYSAELPFAFIAETESSTVQRVDQDISAPKVNGIQKLRRPFKKRDGSTLRNLHTSNRIDRHLATAIEAQYLDLENEAQIGCLTLCLHSKQRETQYRRDMDPEFAASLWCSLLLVVCGAGIQALVLPRTLFLLLLFLTAFAWVTSLLMLLLAARLQWILWDVTRSFTLRLALTIFTVLLVFSVSILNVFTCLPNPICDASNQLYLNNEHLACPVPLYVPLGGILSCLAVAVFFRLLLLAKLTILVFILIGYVLFVHLSHADLFLCYDSVVRSLVPAQTTSLVQLAFFLLASGVHGRCLERAIRLCYLRRNEANKARHEANVLQQSGVRLLHDLLPQHVTQYYLDRQRRPGNNDIYHDNYACVGVLFATVTDYHEFCTEMDASNNGVDSLRQLNEIICDFDKLLLEECFGVVDKIKCFGSTYMAAVGLNPDYKINPADTNSVRKYISILLDFTQAMHARLLSFNASTYRNFMLRAGIDMGPVIAGVIGAHKPQYDIWGETVNIAYHMDSTGLAGLTQVTENVAHAIRDSHYNFRCRGMVKIKGKGDTMTYLLVDRHDHQFSKGATYGRISPNRLMHHQLMNQPLNRYDQCVPAKYVQQSLLNRGNPSNLGENSRLLPYCGNAGPHVVKVLPMQKNSQHMYRPEPPPHRIYEQPELPVQNSLSQQLVEPFLKPLPKPPLPDHAVPSYHIRRSDEPAMPDTRGSSVDELSSQLHSASSSSSSSDESYSNTDGDAPTSPVKKWLYPGDVQNQSESDKLVPPNWMPPLPPLPAAALLSIAAGADSTTTGSVAPACETEAGYSCASFEYLGNKAPGSTTNQEQANLTSNSGPTQFEREIQRMFERRHWPVTEPVSHSVGLAAIQELARSQEPRCSESVCESTEDNTEGEQEEQLSTRDCSHSEWSDEEEEPEDGQTDNGANEGPDRESGGYTTDEQGLENVSLLNEAGLTDAEGALSDVNSLYHHPDHDNGSISSRSSSRAISLDSLSGMYCDSEGIEGWPGLALLDIRSVSESITRKFGCSDTHNNDSDL